MDKKPLIVVSLCAVVILVLASLGNVVGYQSVKSTVDDSPLFLTRTQRATNQQQNSITSQYLGMGKGNFLQFPIRDSQTEQLKKAIDIIGKMDDKTYAQFTELCVQRTKQNRTFSDTNFNEITRVLIQLRTKPDTIKTFLFSGDNYIIKESDSYLETEAPYRHTICYNWIPGCLISNIILYLLLTIPLLLIEFINMVIYTIMDRCDVTYNMCFPLKLA